MIKRCYFFIMIFLLVGCTSSYKEYQANLATLLETTADLEFEYGPKPMVDKDILELSIKSLLKDPDSAKFIWGDLYKCDFPSKKSAVLPRLGWCVEVSYNAKNSFGAYVGYKSYRYRYYEGDLHSMCIKDHQWGWFCRDV